MRIQWMMLSAAVWLLSLAMVSAAGPSTKIGEFSLDDHRGQTVRLADFDDKPLVVVAFLGAECPLAKLYGPRLSAVAEKYADRGVAVIGINSNRQDSIRDLGAYVRDHEIRFPLLKDPGNVVADAFAAQRTPEVFVLDAQRQIRYQGRIDDQYGIGYVKDQPTQRDLELALDALLSGKEVSTPVTNAVGCLIGRVRTPQNDAPITYSNQVSRILQKRCVECHREGEIGPFALTSYEEAAGWADMIVEVVNEGRMPPWHANPEYGHFSENRRLTDEEKSTLRAWASAGAPEGDPAQLPPPLEVASQWQISGEPDLVVPMADQPFHVKAEGEIRYQYFVVDPKLTEDTWIRGGQVLPGNYAVVHHVLVFATRGDRNDLEEGGSRGYLVGYVPGLRVREYPKGLAKRIPAGSRLVFQVHYTPNGREQTDLSRLALWFADPESIKYEARTTSAVSRRLEIPPHAAHHKVEATSPPVPEGSVLLAMTPHMHLRGSAFRYEARYPDGSSEILLDVPHYDFNWQTAYCMASIKQLPGGTRMHCTAHYNNSADNPANPDPTRTVRWGDQTWEEMMIGYFEIAVPRTAGEESAPAAVPALGAGGAPGAALLMRRLDANGDGVLQRDEVPERNRNLFDRCDTNRDGTVTMDELERAMALLRLAQ